MFCCFTSQVNSYGHAGAVSSPNHTLFWASLNQYLMHILSPVKPLSHQTAFPLLWHEVVQILERHEIASKSWYFSRKRADHDALKANVPPATKALVQSAHDVLSRSLAILCALTMFHCVFTGLAMRALRFHDVHTAMTACWRRSVGIFPTFRSFGQGPV